MKKMADLMEELGFRPDGSDEVKKAFVKNLIKQANISEFARQETNKKKSQKDKSNSGSTDTDDCQQISLFDQKASS